MAGRLDALKPTIKQENHNGISTNSPPKV